MKKVDNDQLIEGFLDGTQDSDAQKLFEDKIKSDTNFASEVAKYQKVKSTLNALGAKNLKADMQGWDKTNQKVSFQSKAISIRQLYAIAAVVLLLITAGVLFINNNTSMTPSEVYAKNYSPYEDMILTRDAVEDGNSGLIRGMEAYNNQNYSKSALHLTQYLDTHQDQYGVALYLAISQMENEEFEKAEESFTLAQKDSSFSQQAQWYQALAYLKAEQLERAVSGLAEISSQKDHYKSDVASAILKELK